MSNFVLNDSLLHLPYTFENKNKKDYYEKINTMKPGAVLFDFNDSRSVAIHDKILFKQQRVTPNFHANGHFYALKRLSRSLSVNREEEAFLSTVSRYSSNGYTIYAATKSRKIYKTDILNDNGWIDTGYKHDTPHLNNDLILKLIPDLSSEDLKEYNPVIIDKKNDKGFYISDYYAKQYILQYVVESYKDNRKYNSNGTIAILQSDIENYFRTALFGYKKMNEYKESDHITFFKNIECKLHDTFGDKTDLSYNVGFFYNENQRESNTDYLWVRLPTYNERAFFSDKEMTKYKHSEEWLYESIVRPLRIWNPILKVYEPIRIGRMLNGASIKDIQVTPDCSCVFILDTAGKVYSFGNYITYDELEDKRRYENYGILSHCDEYPNLIDNHYNYITKFGADQIGITSHNSYIFNKEYSMITVAGKSYTTGLSSYKNNDNPDQIQTINGFEDNTYFKEAIDFPFFYKNKISFKTEYKSYITNIMPVILETGYSSLIIEVLYKKSDVLHDNIRPIDNYEYYMISNDRQGKISNTMHSTLTSDEAIFKPFNLDVDGSDYPYLRKDVSYYEDIINPTITKDKKCTKIYYKLKVKLNEYDGSGNLVLDENGLVVQTTKIYWINLFEYMLHRALPIEAAIKKLRDTHDIVEFNGFILNNLDILPSTNYTGVDGKVIKINEADGKRHNLLKDESYCRPNQLHINDIGVKIARGNIKLVPVYKTSSIGVQYIEKYKVTEFIKDPILMSNKDLKIELTVDKSLTPEKFKQVYGYTIYQKTAFDNLKDVLVSVNGRFCSFTYYDDVDDNTIYLNNVMNFLEPRKFKFNENADTLRKAINYLDYDIKFYKWDNVGISGYVAPASIITEDINFTVNTSIYPNLANFLDPITKKYHYKIPTELYMDEPFDPNDCLLFMNGAILKPEQFEIDPDNKKHIYIKHMRDFAYGIVEQTRLEYLKNREFIPKEGYLIAALNKLTALTFNFVKLYSKDVNKKVKIAFDRNNITNIPYNDEVMFNNSINIEDLIINNGIAKNYTWEDIDVIKYYNDIEDTYKDSLFFTKTMFTLNEINYSQYKGDYFKITQNQNGTPIDIVKKLETLSEIRLLVFGQDNISGMSKEVEVYKLVKEKMYKDKRLHLIDNEITRVCPLLVMKK